MGTIWDTPACFAIKQRVATYSYEFRGTVARTYCVFCNQAKGSDIGSIHWESGQFVRFFNPRTDRWVDHFKLAGYHIEGITAIGAVTADLGIQQWRAPPGAAKLSR